MSVKEKALLNEVSSKDEEMSESKPSMKCRESRNDVKTRFSSLIWDRFGDGLEYCPSGIRHLGGMTSIQAQTRNVGISSLLQREKCKWGESTSMRVPTQEVETEWLVVAKKLMKMSGAKKSHYLRMNHGPTELIRRSS